MTLGSVGWFVSTPCDVEFVQGCVEKYTKFVHVSFYERQDLSYVLAVSPFAEMVHSVHLPKELQLVDYKEGGAVDTVADALGVVHFVVHPWAADLDSIVEEVMRRGEYCLCLEAFSFSKGRGSVMALIERYGTMMRTSNLGMCFDFSHIEPELLTWSVVRGLMPYTKIFHVSAVSPNGEKHTPCLRGPSYHKTIKLLGQICLYPADVREIVLEYDKVYERELIKDSFRLDEFLQQIERRKKRKEKPRED